jgi:hypothetical protein
MYNEARNKAAMAAGQARWDNMLPDEHESYLETTEGKNALYDAATDMLHGRDAWGVSQDIFIAEVGIKVGEICEEGNSTALERLLCQIAGQRGKYPELHDLLLEFLGEPMRRDGRCSMHDMAERMLAPYAEANMAQDEY